MKLAIALLVSMLAVAQASACPYPSGDDSHQLGGGWRTEEPVEKPARSWIVWLSLLGVAAASLGIAVRPRVAE